jgi:hypothetical protein
MFVATVDARSATDGFCCDEPLLSTPTASVFGDDVPDDSDKIGPVGSTPVVSGLGGSKHTEHHFLREIVQHARILDGKSAHATTHQRNG